MTEENGRGRVVGKMNVQSLAHEGEGRGRLIEKHPGRNGGRRRAEEGKGLFAATRIATREVRGSEEGSGGRQKPSRDAGRKMKHGKWTGVTGRGGAGRGRRRRGAKSAVLAP